MSKVEPRRRQPEVMPMSNIKQKTKKLRGGPYNKGNSVWVYITIWQPTGSRSDEPKSIHKGYSGRTAIFVAHLQWRKIESVRHKNNYWHDLLRQKLDSLKLS